MTNITITIIEDFLSSLTSVPHQYPMESLWQPKPLQFSYHHHPQCCSHRPLAPAALTSHVLMTRAPLRNCTKKQPTLSELVQKIHSGFTNKQGNSISVYMTRFTLMYLISEKL